MNLQTERLILTPVEEAHFGDFRQLYGDARVMRWVGSGVPLAPEVADLAVTRMARHWADNGFGMFAVRLKATGEFIGRCGICRLDNTPDVEVGYTLLPEFWGHGYATEGAKRCLEFGFGEIGLGEILGITLYDNVRSQNVLMKCGLGFQGTAYYYRAHVLLYGLSAEQHALLGYNRG